MALVKTSGFDLSGLDPRTSTGREGLLEVAQIADIFKNGFPRSTDADTIEEKPQSNPNPTTKQGDNLITVGQPQASVLNTVTSKFSGSNAIIGGGVVLAGIVAFMVLK